MPEFGIVIHGGAGTIIKRKMTPELERGYRQGMSDALNTGYRVLEEGGNSLDAVHRAILVLEDNPLFNAGKGSVFTADGRHLMDASIMDGATLQAGAVAGVRNIKNPITLARTIMERLPHVLLGGDGAEAYARSQGVEFAPDEYFHTELRWQQLLETRSVARAKGDRSPDPEKPPSLGTVGAVAVDRSGNLAAATSTGGMSNCQFGRIGDSPILGAGTYASNRTCAVSTTGHGEYLMRGVVAYDLSAMMEYRGTPLSDAAQEVIHGKLSGLGGTGGLIAIDRAGNIALPFNTPGMYRGYYLAGGTLQTAIWDY